MECSLYKELEAYGAYMSLSLIEEEAAELLTAKIKSIVGKLYPRNPLQVIGSYSTGLADRLSDFDFNLSFPAFEKAPLDRGPSPTRIKARKAAGRALVRMQQEFLTTRHFKDVELIHARVPIVKAEHVATKQRIEIQALSTFQNTKEYIEAYLAEFPTLRTIYIVIRSALHIRDLTTVYKGGLGSYSIFMMIVNSLKHASSKYARDDLVNHFLYFLEFYGNADLYKYGFSPDPPRTICKRGHKVSAEEKTARLQDPMLRGIDALEPHYPQKPYLLFLQDPANPLNDLGCKAYGIKHVQYLLGNFRESLIETMRLSDEGVVKVHDRLRTHGFLGNLLEANYTSLDIYRQRVRSWVGSERAELRRSDWSESKPELPQQTVPTAAAGAQEDDLKTSRIDHHLKERKATPSLRSKTMAETSTANASESQDDKASTQSVLQTSQVLSQDLFKQAIQAGTPAADAETQKDTRGKPLTSTGWKKWSPSQKATVSETNGASISMMDDRDPPGLSNNGHKFYLLKRLQEKASGRLFRRLVNMDWSTLARLRDNDLRGLGVRSESVRGAMTKVRWT